MTPMPPRQVAFGFILVALAWCCQSAAAQPPPKTRADRCSDDLVERVGEHFHLDNFSYPDHGKQYPNGDSGGLIVAGVCKVWPANNSRVIAAFAYDSGVEHQKDLLVATVDVPSSQIVAAYKGVIEEDGAREVTSSSLRIDTARYALSRHTRAFGVRVSAFRDRCTYEGGFDDELTLFAADGKTLRPVLGETMFHWHYGGGIRCNGEEVPRTEADISISIEPTSTNGYADLRLTARRSDDAKPLSVIVKYREGQYDLRPWKSAFGRWWY